MADHQLSKGECMKSAASTSGAGHADAIAGLSASAGRPATADAPCYVPMEAMAVKGFALAPSISARVEKLVRRTLLQQRNPDSTLVNKVRRYRHTLAGGERRMTVETADTRHTMYYRADTSDEHVISQIFAGGDYDLAKLQRFAEIRDFVERRHREGRRPLIIDAGANIGISAAFFALTFPTALIVAIEPEAGNFELLVKNTRGLDVRCLKAALSAESGDAAVVDPGGGAWAFRTEKSQVGDRVPCVTMNALQDEFGAADLYPFLAKIDIEGGEQDVFASNTGWVVRTPLIVTELHDWLFPKQGTALPFLRCISKLDRDFVYIGEDVFSIANDLSAAS
jgi:FkbM family methyltransferase